jgi:predicted transcriptional regulator
MSADKKTVFDRHRELVKEGKLANVLQEENQDRAEAASYENESVLSRTVQIPLKEYDELKSQQHFIKDKTLIDIIDNIERLVRALRKHIIRKP